MEVLKGPKDSELGESHEISFILEGCAQELLGTQPLLECSEGLDIVPLMLCLVKKANSPSFLILSRTNFLELLEEELLECTRRITSGLHIDLGPSGPALD